MEPLFGCIAVVVVLVVLVGPVAALVIALRTRSKLGQLGAVLEAQRAELEAIRRRLESRAGAGEPVTEVTAPALPVTPVVTDVEPAGAALPAPELATEAAPEPVPVAAPEPATAAAAAEIPPTVRSEEAAAKPGLEERLGARLPVWLGGIALALAGAFLVKYTVERGWLSPTVRVALALLFGVTLLGLGEWMRARSARISQALSAAGIADLYAALLAGIRLYDLIPPVVGFGLMTANTAVAVALALRQGPMIALLGLVGGFVTPALVSTGEHNLQGLLAYLFLLDLGLLVVTRKRHWPGIAAGALAASLLWVIVWLAGAYRIGDAPWLGLFLLASVALFASTTLSAAAATDWGGSAVARTIGFGAVAGGLVLLAVVVGVSGYGALEWAMLGLLAAACLLLARRDEAAYFALAPFGAGIVFALLAVWGYDLGVADASRFLTTLALLGALIAGGSYAASFGARAPARWAWLAAGALVFFPLLGWASTHEELALPWGALALGLGLLAVAAALPVARRRAALTGADPTLAESPGDEPSLAVLAGCEQSLAALAVAATAHISLAVPLELSREWLSVAWALEVPALVWLRARLAVPVLGRLAALLAGAAGVRLLLNPEVLDYPIGDRPVWNILLWGYGAPLVAFLIGARRARASAQEKLALGLEWGAVAFAFALVTLQVWQVFRPGDLAASADDRSLAEWGTQAVAWLLLGLALLAVAERRPAATRAAFAWGGRGIVALAGAQTILVHGVLENPAWEAHAVGATPVVNLLLWAYGAPLLLLLAAARAVEAQGGRKLPRAAQAVALALGFLLVTLEVRQLFRGSDLTGPASSGAEGFAYSAAWALLGTGLLVAGIATASRWLRFAALIVMLLAVLKVFLLDTAKLADLYRVFSFLGLGASLLLLAWLYQRFVFRAGEKR